MERSQGTETGIVIVIGRIVPIDVRQTTIIGITTDETAIGTEPTCFSPIPTHCAQITPQHCILYVLSFYEIKLTEKHTQLSFLFIFPPAYLRFFSHIREQNSESDAGRKQSSRQAYLTG